MFVCDEHLERTHGRSDPSDSRAKRAAQPLVARTDDGIGAACGRVDRHRAERLRRVQDEVRTHRPSSLCDGREVVPLARYELDVRESDNGRVRIDAVEDRLQRRVEAGVVRREPHLDPAGSSALPRVHCAWECSSGRDDVGARSGAK